MTPPARPLRVAYITCDTQEWFDLAARLRDTRGWEPVYWITEPRAESYLRDRFPGVVTHSRYDAYHMVPPADHADLQTVLVDEALLSQYHEAELVALKMMDVMDSVDAFDYNARRRFFHQRLAYWLSTMERVQPDVCVFAFSAHVIYDYLIYAWCRLHGRRTIMLENTFNFALLMAFEDPLMGSVEIAEAYDRLIAGGAHEAPVDLPEYCERHLARVRGPYKDAVPWYMKDQFKAFPKRISRKLYQGEERRRRPGSWVSRLYGRRGGS